MAEFLPGDRVFITKIKKNGTLIAVRKNGTCTVAIGSLNMSCRIRDLAPASSAKGAETYHSIKGTARVAGKKPRISDSLDLHGLTRAEALTKLDDYISNAVLADMTAVDIVHGIGSGILKTAVHEALKNYSSVKNFEVLMTNPGTTRVYLG